MSETSDKNQVLLKINLENESGKHFISLDRNDITCYPEEKEILLQAGITAKIINIQKEKTKAGDTITIFNLYVSESMVRKQKNRNVLI